MVEFWSHGVGSSCKGNEYHHEIVHAIENGVTLCGVEKRGKDWHKTNYASLVFEDGKVEKRRRLMVYDCNRCARAMQKRK